MIRYALLCSLFIACARSAPTTPARPQASPAPALDDAGALARARAFLSAVDRLDTETFRAIVTPGFILFEDSHRFTADKLSKGWAKSLAAGVQPRTRTCKPEHVHRDAAAIVYVGDCTEHMPATKKRPAQSWQGWNTVVLVPSAGKWRVALWQWQRSGIAAERERWNDALRRGVNFIKEPNALLVSTVETLRPGKALVLAMGQGRNALYLASKGWQVTGIDIADEGIRAAKQAAAERKLTLDAVQMDIDKYDFGRDRWDLVTMLYAGDSEAWLRRLQPGVRKGGLVVVEYFHHTDNGGFKTGQLAKLFAGWEILRDDVVEAKADWTLRKTKMVRFVARKP